MIFFTDTLEMIAAWVADIEEGNKDAEMLPFYIDLKNLSKEISEALKQIERVGS